MENQESDLPVELHPLEFIVEGRESWSGSGQEALEAIGDAQRFLAHQLTDDEKKTLPSVPSAVDWRRIPGKAQETLDVWNKHNNPEPEPAEEAPDDSEPEGPGLHLVPDAEAEPQGETAEDEPEESGVDLWVGGPFIEKLSTLATRVLERLKEGGGVSMEQFKEALGSTDAAVRSAIKEIRGVHQSDKPLHPVNHATKWWTAKELSAMGKELQHTPRGLLKVVTKPRGERNKAAKVAHKAMSAAELRAKVQEILQDHPDTEELMTDVMARHDEFFAAEQNYKDKCEAARDIVGKAKAYFQELAEMPVPATGSTGDRTLAQANKCANMESGWQGWQEKEALGVEIRKEARERKKMAESRLQTLMDDLRQTTIPGV